MVELDPATKAAILAAMGLGGSSSSGGSAPISYGDMYYDPRIGKYVQVDSRGNISVVGEPVQQATGTNPLDANNDGLVDATGRAVGVQAVPQSVSPTGFVYGNTPVWPNGAALTQTELAQFGFGGPETEVPGYTGIKEGTKGLYGLNNLTGQYELIPGSEVFAKGGTGASAATSSFGGYSGGVGGLRNTDSLIAQIGAQYVSEMDKLNAANAARMSEIQAQLGGQKEILAQQQAFQGQQSALQRAFQAAQQAWQSGVTNRQLQQQEEALKRQAANDFRSAVSDTDPIAYAAMLKANGTIENALRGGNTALTDRSMAGAAGLLDLIRRPFQEIPGFTWSEGGGTAGGGGTGAPAFTGGVGTGATGGATGGTGAQTAQGGMDAATSQFQNNWTNWLAENMPRNPWVLEGSTWTNRETGETAQAMPGTDYNGPAVLGYMNFDAMPEFQNTFGRYGGTPEDIYGTYGGLQQAIDPTQPGFAGPYRGYTWGNQTWDGSQWVAPQGVTTEVSYAEEPGTKTRAVVPGLTVEGYAGGTGPGMFARGLHITGEPVPGSDKPNPELVQWTPQGNIVRPVPMQQARRMLRGGLRGYAFGTLGGWGYPTYTAPQPAPAPTPAPEPVYQEPAPAPEPVYTAPAPTTTTTAPIGTGATTTTTSAPSGYVYGGANVGYIPQATYDAMQAQQAAPVTTSTGGSTATQPATTSSTSSSASGSSPSSTTTPPVETTSTTPTSSLDGLVNYGGQEITPEYQALLDEIRNFRTDPTQNVYDRTLNPWDVSFNNLDPIQQEIFYRGRQAEFGIPFASQVWEQNRYRLPGLSRASVGIGY